MSVAQSNKKPLSTLFALALPRSSAVYTHYVVNNFKAGTDSTEVIDTQNTPSSVAVCVVMHKN